MNIRRFILFLSLGFNAIVAQADGIVCEPLQDEVTSVIYQSLRSTVTIVSELTVLANDDSGHEYTIVNIGSGFVFDDKNNIIGSGHVARIDDGSITDNNGNIVAEYNSGNSEKVFTVILSDCSRHPLTLVKYGDEELGEPDVALWRLNLPFSLPALPLDKSGLVNSGDVFALGSPSGHVNTVYAGMVVVDEEFIISTAFIKGGNSGGPLVNSTGEAVGVLQGYQYVEEIDVILSYAIPILQAVAFLGLI